ncbi:jg19647, partial [Pararge aegeria aegeria]
KGRHLRVVEVSHALVCLLLTQCGHTTNCLTHSNHVLTGHVSPGTSRDILSAVPAYHSSESDSEGVKRAKKQRRDKKWIVINQYPNAEEAESFVKSESTWSRNYTRTCEDGTKKFYRCNRVKKRGPQCDAELYFLYVNDGDKVIAYQTDCEHNHDAIGTRDSYGVHEKTKHEIDKLLGLRLKPKGILAALSKIQGVKMPTKRQLDNYLCDRRSAAFGRSAIYLGELEQWIHNRTAIPDDDNEVFVISNHRTEGSEPSFRFALSTKRLLGMIRFTDVMHAGATYNLIWQGFPVFTVGAMDRNRKFHPLCLWVASNQRQEDFQAIFDGLKEKVMLIYDHVMRPRVLVCDGAHHIQNAFHAVFGVEPITRICWSRTKKNMQKIVAKIVTHNDQKSVLEDIDSLHNASSPEVFHAAAQAFLTKWKHETVLVQHIKEEWLNKNSNWFLGAAPLSPSTNDALESFNRSIKEHNA